jgi:hypothetical protein
MPYIGTVHFSLIYPAGVAWQLAESDCPLADCDRLKLRELLRKLEVAMESGSREGFDAAREDLRKELEAIVAPSTNRDK